MLKMQITMSTLQRVGQVLRQDWDPIGIGAIAQAADEYDSYLPEVMRLLAAGAAAEAIAARLLAFEQDMGLSPSPARVQRVATRLVAERLVAETTERAVDHR